MNGLCMVKHPPTPVNFCNHMSPAIFCYYFTDLKHNFHYFIIIIIVLEPLPQPHPRLFPGLFFKSKNFKNFLNSPLNPTPTPTPQFKNSLKCLCNVLFQRLLYRYNSLRISKFLQPYFMFLNGNDRSWPEKTLKRQYNEIVCCKRNRNENAQSFQGK